MFPADGSAQIGGMLGGNCDTNISSLKPLMASISFHIYLMITPLPLREQQVSMDHSDRSHIPPGEAH